MASPFCFVAAIWYHGPIVLVTTVGGFLSAIVGEAHAGAWVPTAWMAGHDRGFSTGLKRGSSGGWLDDHWKGHDRCWEAGAVTKKEPHT